MFNISGYHVKIMISEEFAQSLELDRQREMATALRNKEESEAKERFENRRRVGERRREERARELEGAPKDCVQVKDRK